MAQRGALGTLVLATGCSLMMAPTDHQCSNDSDCASLGSSLVCREGLCHQVTQDAGDGGEAGTDDPWSCVGDVTWPAAGPPVTLSLKTVDMSKNSVTPDVVRACNKLDLTCATPTATDFQYFDGVVTLQVPGGFDGFIEVTATGWLDGLVTPSRPMTEDYDFGEFVLMRSEDLALIAALGGVGVDINPDAGHGFILALDCQNDIASGVELTVDKQQSDTVGWYLNGGLPSADETETSADGQGGFINLPPGIRIFQGTIAEKDIVYSTVSTVVRASTITYIDMPPTPD